MEDEQIEKLINEVKETMFYMINGIEIIKSSTSQAMHGLKLR